MCHLTMSHIIKRALKSTRKGPQKTKTTAKNKKKKMMMQMMQMKTKIKIKMMVIMTEMRTWP